MAINVHTQYAFSPNVKVESGKHKRSLASSELMHVPAIVPIEESKSGNNEMWSTVRWGERLKFDFDLESKDDVDKLFSAQRKLQREDTTFLVAELATLEYGLGEEEFDNFLEQAGMLSLSEFDQLRTFSEFRNHGGRFGFRRSKTELVKPEEMTKFQASPIPRSLTKLSRQHSKLAKLMFKDLLGIMQCVYHAYPSSLLSSYIFVPMKHTQLRDEAYCQLIKQTSGNPNREALIMTWRLLFVCLCIFAPSKKFAPFLMSHIAWYAPDNYKPTKKLGSNSVSDLAMWGRLALHRSMHNKVLEYGNSIPLINKADFDVKDFWFGIVENDMEVIPSLEVDGDSAIFFSDDEDEYEDMVALDLDRTLSTNAGAWASAAYVNNNTWSGAG